MKIRPLSIAFLTASLTLAATTHARGGEGFAPELALSESGEAHRLVFTGEAERVFLFFRVYAIAHYAELAGRALISQGNVMADGRAKAIVIRFQRKLDAERIRDEFAKSILKNAQPEWLAEAETTIAAFIGAIDRDARKGDQLVFYWLAGGRLLAEFNGERSFEATDTAFASLIWSVWFGDDPVVDREGLLADATSEGDQ